LHEAGYALEEVPTRPHGEPVRRFERDRANQLWQTDLFSFVLKRQNRRVYLVAFLDDHSRFVVGYGLHASQSTALVLEVLRAAMAGLGTPDEVLTDNGTQYVTWRGKSAFARECERRGDKTAVASDTTTRDAGGRAAGAGEDRAVLGDVVAGVRRGGGVYRPGRGTAADRLVHRPLQLPAAAPGDRRADAGRPVLRGNRGREANAGSAGGGQRAGAGA